jgi:hypothetical protein
MRETRENMWRYYLIWGHYLCITTNGDRGKDGRAIMGNDTGFQTGTKVHGISKSLGQYLFAFGNHAGFLHSDFGSKSKIIVFPVKNNWHEPVNLNLTRESTNWLRAEACKNPANIYHLPYPICANLELETQVKPLVQSLPDNVFIHHFFAPERKPEAPKPVAPMQS